MTQLHITPKYIIFGLNDGTVHILDSKGGNGRTLKVERAAWAICSWEDEWIVVGEGGGECRIFGLGDL